MRRKKHRKTVTRMMAVALLIGAGCGPNPSARTLPRREPAPAPRVEVRRVPPPRAAVCKPAAKTILKHGGVELSITVTAFRVRKGWGLEARVAARSVNGKPHRFHPRMRISGTIRSIAQKSNRPGGGFGEWGTVPSNSNILKPGASQTWKRRYPRSADEPPIRPGERLWMQMELKVPLAQPAEKGPPNSALHLGKAVLTVPDRGCPTLTLQPRSPPRTNMFST